MYLPNMHVNAVTLCEDESNTNLFCSNSITRRCLRALLVMLNPLSSWDIASFSSARQLSLKVTLSSQRYNWASYPGESRNTPSESERQHRRCHASILGKELTLNPTIITFACCSLLQTGTKQNTHWLHLS